VGNSPAPSSGGGTPDLTMQVNRQRARTGFALVMILWLGTLLGTLGLTSVFVAREIMKKTHNRSSLLVARWNAEGCAGVAIALLNERLAGADGPQSALAVWNAVDTAVALHRVSRLLECRNEAEPQRQLLDINRASMDELAGALRYAMKTVAADSVADAIADWRDADGDARPLGAEASWYRRAGRREPRDGAFRDVRELRFVRGAEHLDSLFTTDSARLFLERAPLPVLAAQPGFTRETVGLVALQRSQKRPWDLGWLLDRSTTASRERLLAAYSGLAAATAASPDSWLLFSTGEVVARAQIPGPEYVIELRLQRAGSRVAVTRRREWVR
jgi:type II secretory pathway component PulK